MARFFAIYEKFNAEGNVIPAEEDNFPIKFFTLNEGLVSIRPGHQLDELYRQKCFQLALSDLIQHELMATRGVKTFYVRMRARLEDILSLMQSANDYCKAHDCDGFRKLPSKTTSRTRISIQGYSSYLYYYSI